MERKRGKVDEGKRKKEGKRKNERKKVRRKGTERERQLYTQKREVEKRWKERE